MNPSVMLRKNIHITQYLKIALSSPKELPWQSTVYRRTTTTTTSHGVDSHRYMVTHHEYCTLQNSCNLHQQNSRLSSLINAFCITRQRQVVKEKRSSISEFVYETLLLPHWSCCRPVVVVVCRRGWTMEPI